MKDELIRLINAYGTARSTGDALLQQWSTESLMAFLEGCEISEVAPPAECPMPGAGSAGAPAEAADVVLHA